MTSRRYGQRNRPNYGYDPSLNSGRGPGPWQDGYQNHGDNYTVSHGGYSSHGIDAYYGTYDTAHGYSDNRDAYGIASYDYSSYSEQYYPSDTYREYYQEPFYPESYSAELDGPYQSSSRGHGEAQMTYARQGFDDHLSHTRAPSSSHNHIQSRNIHHNHTPMSNTGERSPKRRLHSPPPAPPRPPSPSYLSLANEEPEQLSTSSDRRKLLILDLNGTLVFRSVWRGKTKHQHAPPSASAAGDPGDAGSAPPPPRLRTAHPRPYLPAFRDYLFAPETQRWLDVMVWSSAQPHSVQGMVERVFGQEAYAEGIANGVPGSSRAGGRSADGVTGGSELEDGEEKKASKPRLVAIWARDTLGLSNSNYHQKVQTVKDLNIPWSKLPSILSPPSAPVASTASASLSEHLRSRSPSPKSSPLASPLSRPATPPDTSPPTSSSTNSPTKDGGLDSSTSPHVHSALSTLLLDDSPLKAVRQPYNHVCIPEYDGKQRASDLALFMRQRTQEELGEAQMAVPSAPAPEEDLLPKDTSGTAEPPGDDAPTVVGLAEDVTGEDPDASRKRKRLEKKLRKREERLAKAADAPIEEEQGAFDPTLLAVVGVLDEVKRQRNVAAWIRAGGLWGPARTPEGASAGKEVEEVDAGQDAAPRESKEGAPADVDEDGRDEGKRKRRRRRRSERPGGQMGADETPGVAPGEGAAERPTSPSGNDKSSTDIKSDAPPEPREAAKTQPMWFEDPATLRYWVQRGRDALDELGLTADHGIER